MRPPKRNDAKFMSMADVRRAGLLKPKGIFIGRAGGRLVNVFAPHRDRRTGKLRLTRPRVRGGRKLWIDGDDVGGFVIGPPRSGKGAALIIPNALMWPHSLVVLDLRGEPYEATAAFLMRPPKRNDAKFMSMADVRRAGLLKPKGIFIGRAGGRLVN
ncbi:hypothetical protein EOA25_41935, partial [Mesorhizobium sp. M2A.F.Ca.ET.040.01.1.1]